MLYDGRKYSNAPIKLVIQLDGGIINNISVNNKNIKVLILDYDIGQAEPEELMTFKRYDGKDRNDNPIFDLADTSWARSEEYSLDIDPKYVDYRFEEYEKQRRELSNETD